MTDILDQLGNDTAPRNFEEFELGMTLAAIIQMITDDDENFDPLLFDQFVEVKAPEALEYWRNKYADEIIAAGGKECQGPDRGE